MVSSTRCAVTNDGGLDLPTGGRLLHEPRELACAPDALAVELDDHVAGFEPGHFRGTVPGPLPRERLRRPVASSSSHRRLPTSRTETPIQLTARQTAARRRALDPRARARRPRCPAARECPPPPDSQCCLHCRTPAVPRQTAVPLRSTHRRQPLAEPRSAGACVAPGQQRRGSAVGVRRETHGILQKVVRRVRCGGQRASPVQDGHGARRAELRDFDGHADLM